jgi:endonuclease/exonuclease/phosphatase family metal-dependent hydrolase
MSGRAGQTACRVAVVLAALCCGCAGADPEPELPPSGEFSVLTYNVHGLPSSITGDDTTARMHLIAPLLGAFDVVGLQEDFIDSNHDILDAASEHPLRVRFSALYDADRVYGSGLALWSPFTEVERQQRHFGSCHGLLDSSSDCFASKGFQALRQELAPGLEVDFYNTHLEAGGGDEDNAVRAGQVAMLVESLTGWSAGRAVVFTGDFNLHGDDPQDIPLLDLLTSEAGLSDSCVEVGCPEPERIDRLLFRDSAAVLLEALSWNQEQGFTDAQGVDLSDHDALSARFAWSSASAD